MEHQTKSITGTYWQGCLLLSQQGRRLPGGGSVPLRGVSYLIRRLANSGFPEDDLREEL